MSDGIRRLETTGELQTISGRGEGGLTVGCVRRITYPFTSLIPLLHVRNIIPRERGGPLVDSTTIGMLLRAPNRLSLMLPENIQRLVDAKRKRLSPGIELALSATMSSNNSSNAVYTEIVKMISNRSHLFGRAVHDRTFNNNTKDMAAWFDKPTVGYFTLRSCSGYIGWYSLVVIDGATGSAKYHILAVIAPENLYYQCMYWVLTGNFDMRYVIILVDESLEGDSFENKGLRTFYLGRLKGTEANPGPLRKTAAQVFFVPQEFIEQQCFVQPFKLPKCSVKERKDAITSMGHMFKHFVITKDMNMSLLLLPKSELHYTPWVPGVEPTSTVSDRLAELQGRATPAIVSIEHVNNIISLHRVQREAMLEMRNQMGVPAETLRIEQQQIVHRPNPGHTSASGIPGEVREYYDPLRDITINTSAEGLRVLQEAIEAAAIELVEHSDDSSPF